METLVEGIVLGLSITAPVGPTNIEVIRRGLKQGWKSAAVFCLGVAVALILYLLIVLSGLSFLTESEIFNTGLLILGVIVLFGLAYDAAKDFLRMKEMDLSDKATGGKQFLPGLVLTFSNPAVLLLWTGILGTNFATGGGSPQRGRLLSIGILAGVSIFFAVLISAIHWGKGLVTGNTFRYVSLAAGLVLFAFAIKFGHQLIMKFG